MTKTDIYAMITDRIISELEKGIIPWHKPWTGAANGPYSRATGRPYSLLNQMLLKHSGEYLTYKQAQAAGGNVRKGEKDETVVFWKMVKVTEKDKDNKPVEKMIPMLRYYTVFHISQCEGVEPKYDQTSRDFADIPTAEQVINDYAAKETLTIEHQLRNSAYYSPTFDKIVLPRKDQFTSETEYYSTAFHEMAHSTGLHSRLNRFDPAQKLAAFGSEEYSKEELIAEISAVSLMHITETEVPTSFKNSAAYIQSWLKALKNDKRMIVSAASKAEKAVNYILATA